MSPRLTIIRCAAVRTHCPRTRQLSSFASSVNPTEVSHFDKLASTWWDPHGPSNLLHQMNPLRHDFISQCLDASPNPLAQRRYLDIGCGGGIFAESAARLPCTERVLAIDPSSEVINIAKTHARRDPLLLMPGRLIYENKSINDLFAPVSQQEQFDVVTLFEVLEHVDLPSPFLESCLPFVRSGGWLILSTIARTWTSWLTTKLIAEEIMQLVPKGTHNWGKYINETELRRFFREQDGWGTKEGVRSQGVVYVPGLGWKAIPEAEQWGNYFFGIRKDQ